MSVAWNINHQQSLAQQLLLFWRLNEPLKITKKEIIIFYQLNISMYHKNWPSIAQIGCMLAVQKNSKPSKQTYSQLKFLFGIWFDAVFISSSLMCWFSYFCRIHFSQWLDNFFFSFARSFNKQFILKIHHFYLINSWL